MARRKKHAEHANHERWLVSYADFITLLFAFFVVMFASSQTDHNKASQVSESVRKAIEEGRVAPLIAAVLGGTIGDKGQGNAMMRGPGGREPKPEPPPPADLEKSLVVLSNTLQEDIEAGKIQMRLESRGLVISLREAAFFPSGDDTVVPASYPSIGKIAAAVKEMPNPVRLEGHTDAVPIHNARFQSNWELSARRSIAMLELFTTRFGIPAQRMAVAGYGDTVPADTNGTEEGRARNRRVDVVILTAESAKAEPAAPGLRPAQDAREAQPEPRAGSASAAAKAAP